MDFTFNTMQWHGVPFSSKMNYDEMRDAVANHVCVDKDDEIFKRDIVSVSGKQGVIGSFKVIEADDANRTDTIAAVIVRLCECLRTLEQHDGISIRDCYVEPPFRNFRHACEEWMRIWGDAVLIDDFNKARPDLERIVSYLETHLVNKSHIEKDGYCVYFGEGWPIVDGDSYDGTKQSIGGDAMFYERHNPTPYPEEWKE